MTEVQGYEVIPSAKRLIKSLRDMGYDFATAVADLIDNSIQAGASRVSIDVAFEGDDSFVRIADNGRGMGRERLREAMRYGSDSDYDEDALGKFGLGLKTASMSQCQRMSVASKLADSQEIAAYSWDLDHIKMTNRWEILPLEGKGATWRSVSAPLKESPGTVVLWQRLDRILGYDHPYGDAARKRLSQMCRELEDHLAMVFHKFLAGEVPKRPLAISLNGNSIQPWDPFCRSEPATKELPPVRLAVEYEGALGEIALEPYIVPHQSDFSSPEAFNKASGPANWNQQQGFYIYRNGRMIQSGGWCRLRTSDEHTKLARIGLNFSPVLDDAFKINVSKMRVQLPGGSRDEIAQAVNPVARAAREVYDGKGKSRRAGVASPGLPPNPGTQGATGDGEVVRGSTTPDQILVTLDQLAKLLAKFANPEERRVLDALVDRLKRALRGKSRL